MKGCIILPIILIFIYIVCVCVCERRVGSGTNINVRHGYDEEMPLLKKEQSKID